MSLRALTLFRIGAWSWVITGAGHLTLAGALALRPETAPAARASAAAREYTLAIAGLRRSLFDINMGISTVMGLALIFAGAVCLLVTRSAPAMVTDGWSLSALALAVSLAVLAVALGLLPLPPIVLFAVATAAFGAACARARPVPDSRTAVSG